MAPLTVSYVAGRDSASTTFKTHLNYIKCMHRLTGGMSINLHVTANARLDPTVIARFERLARITKTSIEGEKRACDTEKAYAQVTAPWIPVKCYYRLYYLESVFLYLLEGLIIGFGNGGHKGVRKALKSSIEAGHITLNASAAELAQIVDWATASAFSATSGSTIRANYHADADCPQSLRKKLTEYIELDWKQANRISNYRTKAAQNEKATKLLPARFNLLDYFYWMRIKANYRDVDFLDFDKDINDQDAYEYLSQFIEAAEHYASALEATIASLKAQRGM